MNRPHGPILRVHWFVLALVFLLGVAAGLTLARAAPATRAGDMLAWLALIVLGLGAGAILAGAGWLLGMAVQPGESRAGAAASKLAESGEERVTPLQPPADAATPIGVTPDLQPAPGVRTVSGGERFQLLRDDGTWIVRAKEVLGYESVQVAVGVTPGWFHRVVAPTERRQVARSLGAGVRSPEGLGLILFIAALAIYAFTRLFALDRFPINFFADEAIQVILAMDLIKQGFRDLEGVLFPAYFRLAFFINPDISIYFHALTASLFGKSIEIARGTSAFTTVLAAGAIGIAFKTVFRARYWWAVVLLVGMMPTWLLFSRTTFDAVSMASLYALCVVSYLLYRYRSPRFLYLTVIFGAGTFYAYPSGQPAVGLLALFLLISDLRYHFQQRRTIAGAVVLTLLCAIPFIRFQMAHPDQALYHLQTNNSYWTMNISLGEKQLRFARTYLGFLSPGYWFFPNDAEL
ncbi:MAG: hypothetical protein QG637_288, partial [Chloroflexota bacterium]|nr:hypothetical protein [Chloroflexota bacterium]